MNDLFFDNFNIIIKNMFVFAMESFISADYRIINDNQLHIVRHGTC